MTKLLLGALLTIKAFAQTKTPDLCVPPPSGTAPALPAHLMTGMGTEHVHLAITTSNPKAQKFFDQGLAQLHSFWATEAERSFRASRAARSGCADAVVGRRDDLRRAITGRGIRSSSWPKPTAAIRARPRNARRKPREKAVELSKVPGKATDLEKLYIASIAARRMPGSKDPNDGYIEGLRAIIAKYPNEVEAQDVSRAPPDARIRAAGSHAARRFDGSGEPFCAIF